MSLSWPFLKSYDEDHLRHIALPLGGIGTGTISLGGKGDLRDWEIMNRQAKGFTQEHCFIALYCRREDGSAVARGLEGTSIQRASTWEKPMVQAALPPMIPLSRVFCCPLDSILSSGSGFL